MFNIDEHVLVPETEMRRTWKDYTKEGPANKTTFNREGRKRGKRRHCSENKGISVKTML